MIATVAFFATLAVSVFSVSVVRHWLRKRRIFDLPNERSSHSTATPRGGGLAVTPTLLLAWAALVVSGEGPFSIWPIWLGAAGLLILSWRDDRGGLPVRTRLLVQLAAVVLGLLALPPDTFVFQGLLPLWADRALAGIGWLWFLNLYNFMDGIDGITGVESAVIGGGLALLGFWAGDPEASMGLVIVAASIGFLAWNWHPAAIFLGDSGSVPLGFMLGGLLLLSATRQHWAAALILPAYYLADATLTLGRRALRGEKVWQAHRQHFYQKAIQRGARHDRVATTILLADLLLVTCALLSERFLVAGLVLAVGVTIGLLIILSRQGTRPTL